MGEIEKVIVGIEGISLVILVLAIIIPIILTYFVLKLAIRDGIKEAQRDLKKEGSAEDRTYYMTKSAIRDAIVEAQKEIWIKEKLREEEQKPEEQKTEA